MILAAILAFVTIAGLGFVFVGGGDERTLKRTRAMAERGRPEATRIRLAQPGSDPDKRRKQIMATLKEQEKKSKKAAVTLANRLQQAGIRFSTTVFWIISAVVGVLAAGIALLTGLNPLIALLLGFCFAFGLPRWVVGFLAKKRAAKFVAAFPDATDIIVRGIKSGLPVHDCLKIIGKEAPEPLGPEFTRLVENIGMGMSVDQGLEKMFERMPISEVRFFTIVLSIQQKTGGNLGEALGNLSTVLRARKMMREKIKALSGEAVASAGIIGSLPIIVMVLVSIMTPSYMLMMFTDQRGHLMLLVGGFWMAMGIFVMRKMINFKF